MENNTISNRTEWDKRSLLYGASLKSVLFKGMPDIINQHIHDWHKNVVLNTIEKKKNMRVLDIGCGYGRLSLPVIEKFPEAETIGIDATANYVRLYQEMTRQKAIVGTLENLPEGIGKFDYILCITVLMYTKNKDIAEALKNLIKILKPEGKLILIEPQTSIRFFVRLCGIVDFIEKRMHKERVNTGGRYFAKKEIDNYINACNGSLESKHGLPFSTFFMLPLNLLGKLMPSAVTQSFLKICSWGDRKLDRFGLPSIYYAYVIRKKVPGVV